MSRERPEEFVYLLYIISKEAKITNDDKALTIAEHCKDIMQFRKKNWLTEKIPLPNKKELNLNVTQRGRLDGIKNTVPYSSDVRENWMRLFANNYTANLIEHIRNLSLDIMNINPFLIKALNLRVPKEVIRFNVYQTATISIVTSFGTTVEKIIGYSHPNTRLGKKKEWYDVIKEGADTYWIQVKSGPNDVNKDQVKHMNTVFAEKEAIPNNYAKLGITYGKKDLNTISLTHIRTYLEKWKTRLLVGKDLWEFVSDETGFHKKILAYLDDAAKKSLSGESVNKEIDKVVLKLTKDFEKKFGRGKAGVIKFISESL